MSNNILHEFFKNLADAVRLKLNTDDKYIPTEIAGKIDKIDSSTSGSFHEEVECFVPNGIKSVESVVVSKEVDTITSGAYASFSKLVQVILLGDVIRIEENAFNGCSSLTNINLSDNIQHIGRMAFYNCGSLETINLPNSLIYVGFGAFTGSGWYTKQAPGVVYAGRIACSYKGAMSNGEVYFKEDTYSVCAQLFERSTEIKKVTGYVSTKIETQAFASCTNLDSVELHQKDGEAIILEGNAFKGCTSLREIYFDNIKSIKYGSFDNCPNILSVCLLNNATSIESLSEIIGLATFKNKPNVTIYVADGTIDAWRQKLGNNGEGYNIALYSDKNIS